MKFSDDKAMPKETHLLIVTIIKQHFNSCQFVDCPCFSFINEPGDDPSNRHLRASGDLMIDFAKNQPDFYDQLHLNNNLDISSERSANSRNKAVFLYLTEDKIKR